MPLSDNSRSFLKLLLRSSDLGEGWRQVSTGVWPLVEQFEEKELLELNEIEKKVRLSPLGETVVNYAL